MTSLQRTRTIRSLASLVVGASFGLLDHFASQTGMYDFDTTPAFWLVLVTIVSILSPTPRRACTYALLLLYAMLISYYVSYYGSYGFVPVRLVLLWSGFSLLLSLYGWMIWHVRKVSALAAFPIAYLLQSGYSFIPDLWRVPSA